MKLYTGINIQFPISQLILDGSKCIETRTYPIPEHLLGKELAIIETPGKTGRFRARIVGTITFSRCFKYESETAFYSDVERHHVTPNSPWKWNAEKPKWGWEIAKVKKLKVTQPAPNRRGIVYTKEVSLGAAR